MVQPVVSVVVPTYRRPRALCRCLEALAAQTIEEPWEVVVVDDGSPDAVSWSGIGFAAPSHWRIVRQANAGPSAARNRGVAEARGQLIAFTDDDCRPEPAWLATLVAAARARPGALVGGTTVNSLTHDACAATSQLIVDLVYDHFNHDRDDANFLASNNILCPRDRFLDMGGFDARFPRAGAEDREFCDRWQMHGWPIVWRPEARIEHEHGQTLRQFLELHYRYGRGACRYHAIRRQRGSGTMREHVGFHGTLPRRVWNRLRRDDGDVGRLTTVALLGAWQLANAAGFFAEALSLWFHRGTAETRRSPLPGAGDRLRVVLVSPFAPCLVGGLESVCSRIATGLASMGHSAAFVGQFAASRKSLHERFVDAESPRTFTIADVPVTIVRLRWPLRMAGSVVYAMIWQRWLQRPLVDVMERAFGDDLQAACGNADVVHYLGTGTDPLGFATAAAAEAAGVPLVIQPGIHAGRWGDRPLDGALYRRADRLLAFSESEARVIEGLGVAAGSIERVVGSIDQIPSVDAGSFRRRHGVTGELVVFLGRKTVDKGISLLLDAWPMIRREIPSATLAIIGPVEDRLPDGPRDGIVDVVGASDSEKHEALAACDVFCMPSLGESFGLAIYEACAHGKPVVIGDLQSLRETVGEAGAGLLVALEPAAIAGAVVTLLADPAARATIGQRGRDLAAGLTHDRAIGRYLQIYESVVRPRERA